MGTIAAYPSPSQGGPLINKLIIPPLEYTVIRYEYDDGGLDVNVQPCGLQRWVLGYEGLTAAELAQIVDHYNLAQGRVNEFNWTDPRTATTFTGVKYESLDIPDHVRKWALGASVVLWKFL